MKSACPADITAVLSGFFFGLDFICRVPFQKLSQHIDLQFLKHAKLEKKAKDRISAFC